MDRATVSELVEAAFGRINDAMRHADAQYERGYLTLDQYWTRLAALHARRVRWWAVVEEATYHDPTVAPVYFRAVIAARDTAAREARYRAQQARIVATAAEQSGPRSEDV